MIKINITSLFRDSDLWHGRKIFQVQRFFNQIASQQLLNQIEINKIVCVYTESNDDTFKLLEQEKNKGKFNIDIIKHGSNYQTVKSSASIDRIRELSHCGNVGLESAKENSDYILHVESDILIYDTFLLYKMYDAFSIIDKLGAIAPLILLDINYTYFYDCFVYRDTDDCQWRNKWNWGDNFFDDEQYISMNSVGSCVLLKSDLIRQGCSFKDYAFINLCKEIKSMEHRVCCDKRLFVFHPSNNGLLGQRWC